MFVKAITDVSQYTRPIHTISRTFKGIISPGASTLFFVNEDGVAITCKHVADLLIKSHMVNAHFQNYLKELNALPKDHKLKNNSKALEVKFNYKNDTTVQVKNNFINSVRPITTSDFHLHPTLDLAIIIFKGFANKAYQSYATFVKDPNKIKQGRYLCRLGYPFPEFNNFTFNQATNDIEWTNTGNMATPLFPIDGIITRFVAAPVPNSKPVIGAIEMSTPGLRGQSGGPLFDSDGLVYGMQSATTHLHLGFDLNNHEVLSNGKRTFVSNHPFLHVGHCVHVDRIKEFLTHHKVKFYEG